jgi:PAS domain-containing protein
MTNKNSSLEVRESAHLQNVHRVAMLYNLIPRSVLITLVLGLLTAGVLADQVSRAALVNWLTAVFVVCILRLALFFLYRRARSTDLHPTGWENAATVGAAMMGLTWASLTMVGETAPVYKVFVVLVLGGVSLGSAGILGASVRAFACFTAPILLAQTVELFTLGGTLYNTMGVMAILFIGGLVTSYQEFRSALLASIDARTDMERIHRQQRLIFESVTAGVAFIRDRKIVDHNSQFAKMLG